MGRSLSQIQPVSVESGRVETASFSPDGRHHYRVEQTPEGVFHHERLMDQDGRTIYDQGVKIDYVMGSGNQGRSYLFDRGGILFMSPIGWYSRDNRWDLSPGYTLPTHPRFERLVTEGCLECHTGRMNAVADRENRFQQPPFLEESIGCERCHGPGRGHVDHQRGRNGIGDDPIVNPARLDPPRREDVCNQCHLQGEARSLRAGRYYGDFRPGQRLEEVYVILVRGTRATEDGHTQAVSQVEQMRASACFRKSDGRFGCTSCHNPHVQPAPATRDAIYRERCLNCHSDRGCSLPEQDRLTRQENDSCIACHMPRLNANDVPHTSQTDHRILRVPERQSAGPDSADEMPELFDGAGQRLPRAAVDRGLGIWLAEQAESRADPKLAERAARMLTLVSRQMPNDAEVLNALGTAAAVEGRVEDSLTFWKQALAIDPHRELTLRSTAVQLQKLGRFEAARPQFENYLKLQPWNASMWGRYSVLLGQVGELDPAIKAAGKAIELDPSNFRTHQWLAELYDRKGEQIQRRHHQELSERLHGRDH
jgi:Flp pilus assembly protein TadD